jgi:hypothetical protein
LIRLLGVGGTAEGGPDWKKVTGDPWGLCLALALPCVLLPAHYDVSCFAMYTYSLPITE